MVGAGSGVSMGVKKQIGHVWRGKWQRQSPFMVQLNLSTLVTARFPFRQVANNEILPLALRHAGIYFANAPA